MKYRPEIDGLRAVAVMPVMLFHAGFNAFAGGFVGVDVFFVISGYLITSIVVDDFKSGTFSLLNFYDRRVRRILPLLFLVILICIPFAWLLLLPVEFRQFSRSIIAVSFFSSNFLFWMESGYFDSAAEMKPLLHTWSLAVEEQYYLFFPLLLIGLLKRHSKWLFLTFFLVFSASFFISQFFVEKYPSANFFLLPSRCWELLLGAWAAFLLDRYSILIKSKISHQFGSVLGLCLILASIFILNEKDPFPGFNALPPAFGAFLVIFFASKDNFVGAILSNKIFVRVGLLSYGAYLWHQPIFSFARHYFVFGLDKIWYVVLIFVSLAVAFVTHKYIESYFRDSSKVNRRCTFLLMSVCAFFFVSFGFWGHISRGFPSRVPFDFSAKEYELPKIDNGWCFYSVDSIATLKIGGDGTECTVGRRDSTVHGILFGDSFAGQYEPLWDAVGKKYNFDVRSITTNWCYPALTDGFTGPSGGRAYAQCIYDRKYFAENYSKFDFLVIAGNWADVQRIGRLSDLYRLIDFSASNFKHVYVMASPKAFDRSPLNDYAKSLWRHRPILAKDFSSNKDDVVRVVNSEIEKYVNNYDNVVYVGRDQLFPNSDGGDIFSTDGIPYSMDGTHLSVYGALKVADYFLANNKINPSNWSTNR